jgi:phosphoribosyl 1,2-cyclic phosphodiesterase
MAQIEARPFAPSKRKRNPITLRVDRAKQNMRVVFGCGSDDNSFNVEHGERHTQAQIGETIEAHIRGKGEGATPCIPCSVAVASGNIVVDTIRTVIKR